MEAVSRVTDQLYERWHESLGSKEWRITVSLSGYGRDEEAADALLDAFLEHHAAAGPVVSQNANSDETAVVYSVMAANARHALDLADTIFLDGASRSGLRPVQFRFEIECVQDCGDESPTAEREAIGA